MVLCSRQIITSVRYAYGLFLARQSSDFSLQVQIFEPLKAQCAYFDGVGLGTRARGAEKSTLGFSARGSDG